VLPVAARVGATPRRGGGPLIAQGGARDAWTARMAPAGADGCQTGGGGADARGDVAKGKRESKREG
jgi:hypothetical protein